MYYLYIDGSGDEGEYNIIKDNNKGGSSRFFTLGGTIVNEQDRQFFESELENIKNEFFKEIELSDNFKLHYVALRNQWGVFAGMDKEI